MLTEPVVGALRPVSAERLSRVGAPCVGGVVSEDVSDREHESRP